MSSRSRSLKAWIAEAAPSTDLAARGTDDDERRSAILIVDDDPQILRSVRSLLRPEFVVHTAASGEEALADLDKIDVAALLTDQRMPGLSGLDLLRKARERHPDVVRLLFTGFSDLNVVIDAINQGQVFRYISKPWEPHQLAELLHAACSRHRHIAQRRRLLYDLRRSHAQHMALFSSLREHRFGALSELGAKEASRLGSTGRALIEALDELLKEAESREYD